MNMLLFSNQLHGFNALSTDGIVGHIDEFYFDDQSWKIRYLVLDIGTWLTGRKVLISPASIGSLDWENKSIRIKATKEQIEKSLVASAELPVARALEAQIHSHYGWEYYWPELFTADNTSVMENEIVNHDPHLRSTIVLTDISVFTETGIALGTIDDFLIDPESWQIIFAEIRRGKIGRMLLSTELIRNIDVTVRKMKVTSPW